MTGNREHCEGKVITRYAPDLSGLYYLSEELNTSDEVVIDSVQDLELAIGVK